MITLGIINGGLGLQLSGNTTKGEIAYGVIAGVIWLGWVAVAAMSHFNTGGTSRRGETGEKISKDGTLTNDLDSPSGDGMDNQSA